MTTARPEITIRTTTDDTGVPLAMIVGYRPDLAPPSGTSPGQRAAPPGTPRPVGPARPVSRS